MIKFALAGNPNSGKTTLFNSLTGSTAHVGNWAGVTVDKKVGLYKKLDEQVEIIDLPGIYSLSPYTPEEVIARNYILDEKPNCVINIVDATNIERNLYLTTQIMEIDVPVVIALNFIDTVEKQGDRIDEKELEKRLGVPVVKISALKFQGLDELMSRAYEVSKGNRKGVTVITDTIKHLIGDVRIALKGQGVDNPLFHAVKLVENDEIEVKMHSETVKMVEEFKTTFTDDVFGTEYDALIADARYKYITKNLLSAVHYKNPDRFNSVSSKADKILTHKIWGIPIFLAILFGIFHITFSENFLFLSSIFNLPTLEELGVLTNEGEPINFGVKLLSCVYDGTVFSPGCIFNNIWNNVFIGEFFSLLEGLVESSGLSNWAVGLINQGVLGGVSGVLSFLPWILTLFLLFSILEDSGYMARIAFILDKLFRKFGLSGRAFLPMIMGFGCSVPAMINTRTLPDQKERTATIRVIPFFSCGAKLPILTAISGAIIGMTNLSSPDVIVYSMYVIGITVAIIAIIAMRGTTMRGEVSPLIMELPAYHAPQFKNLMLHLWDKAKHFIEKAFTIIVASSIVIWFLSSFSFSYEFLPVELNGELVNMRMDDSILGSLGKLIQPLFTPLGFGVQLSSTGWVFAVAAITGLIAKENVISTFGTLSACLVGSVIISEDGVAEVQAMISSTGISVAGLLAFIAFNMTTVPCFAAVATAKAELGRTTFNWTLMFWVLTSFITAGAIYSIVSLWWTAFIWVAILALALIIIRLYNKKHPIKQ